MATDDPLLLQVAYVETFKNTQEFIKNNFPLCDDLAELIKRGIIKDKYRDIIANCSSLEKPHKLMESLLNEKDVEAFKKFIILCDEQDIKTYNVKLADRLRKEFNAQKKAVGLPQTGNLVQIMPSIVR